MRIIDYFEQIGLEPFQRCVEHIWTFTTINPLMVRMHNQLKYFENSNLSNVKIADIGSGIGIHANYFKMCNANVTAFEPNLINYQSSQQLFPQLNLHNEKFDFENYDICTLFGVLEFIKDQEEVDNIFNHCKYLIIDSGEYLPQNYTITYEKSYFDQVKNRFRHFSVYKNANNL